MVKWTYDVVVYFEDDNRRNISSEKYFIKKHVTFQKTYILHKFQFINTLFLNF